MSNIYIHEPLTSGKVLLTTSVGDIDIELWAKECPKACRNFIQLCMEGYYNGTIFHRVVKEFIVQGGDPNGDGSGGASIYGRPFPNEYHSRLRFSRRGLVGMAGTDDLVDNGSQFFFTMASTPELQNKNTLFGKVTGDTVFNMLKLEEGMVDHNERPMYPQKIIRAEILNNPFADIVPRIISNKSEKKIEESKKKRKEKGVKESKFHQNNNKQQLIAQKIGPMTLVQILTRSATRRNFGLLSFGEEAEEDEEETTHFVKRNAGKAKSMHDVVDDPKLSRVAVKVESQIDSGDETEFAEEKTERIKEEPDDIGERIDRIKSKLSGKSTTTGRKGGMPRVEIKQDVSESDDDVLITLEMAKHIQSEKRKVEIRQEILKLRKQYHTAKKHKSDQLEKKVEQNNKKVPMNADGNELIQNFIEVKEKYTNLKSKIPKKGANREKITLELLSKFRSKLDALKQKQTDEATANSSVEERVVEKDIQSDDWLSHTLKFENSVPVLAKDASTKSDDWYDAYDPRNPLNKRKRGVGHSSSTKKRTR